MSLQPALIWQQGGGATSLLFQLMPLLLIFGLFYFLIIVPQRKRQSALQALLDNLKPGDKVVTNGGIYGTVLIVRKEEGTVQLKIAESPAVKVDVARSSITGLQNSPEEKK